MKRERLKQGYREFPLRPQGIGVAAILALGVYVALRPQASASLTTILAVGLALGLVYVSTALVSLISYLAFIAGAREFAKGGDAIRLSCDRAVSLDATPRIGVGVPSRSSSAFLSVSIILEFEGFGRGRPLCLSRCSKESLGLSGQGDVPPSLLGGDYDIEDLPSGRYEVKRSILRLEDPLGLFRFSYTEVEKGFSFTIFRVKDRELEIPGKPKEAETELVSREKTRAEGELLEIRKYVPGSDSSRRIVWKLFARTGRLMVRDHEKESVNSARLPLFVCFHSAISHSAAQASFPFAGISASLSEWLLEEYKNSAFAVMKRLRLASFQPIYCPERRVEALERGEASRLAGFDRELETAPEGLRAEVEMACHRWQSNLDFSRQLAAWEGRLRANGLHTDRLFLISQSLDDSWIGPLSERGMDAVVYFKRLSRELLRCHDNTRLIQRILFLQDGRQAWERDDVEGRILFSALKRRLEKREEEALARARAASITVIEV